MENLFNKLAARPQRSIVLLSLLLLLAGNWILPLTDRDETRFAEASREMLQRGDYVVPWFNGAWRFDKPVLIYWCQIASYRVLGDNDFAARLPSALFATATALLLVRWGRKIANDKTAFLAGVMFVTGLHVAIIGRVATADMAMIFFVTLAAWSGWELTKPEQPLRRRWWWIFYITLAFGFLAKGPVAWTPLGAMILGRLLRKGSFRLPLAETAIGLCLAVGLVALWGAPAMAQTGGEFFNVGMGKHVVGRSLGAMEGHGISGALGFIALMPLYFVTFLVSFFPWSTRVPGALRHWCEFRKWVSAFKASTTPPHPCPLPPGEGDPHTAKPVMDKPRLRQFRFSAKRFLNILRNPESQRDDLGWFLMVNALIVFAAFSLVKTKLPHYTMPAFPCIALWLALRVGGENNLPAWAGKRMVAMTVFILALMLGFFTFARGHLATENVWNQVRNHVRHETKVGCFGYTEPSLVWKFRGTTTNLLTLGSVEQAKDFLTNTPPFILVLPTKNLTNLPSTSGLQFRVSGLDMVKFKNRDLTAIVVQTNVQDSSNRPNH